MKIFKKVINFKLQIKPRRFDLKDYDVRPGCRWGLDVLLTCLKLGWGEKKRSGSLVDLCHCIIPILSYKIASVHHVLA